MSSDHFLPYGRHTLDDADIEAVVEVLKGGPLTCGPQIEKFETAFARNIGAEHAIVCSNGTAALHMAVIEAGLGIGDVAIVPSITFLATANAVRMVGAEVCFADVCPETGLMTAQNFIEALERTSGAVKAVLPVHMNGQSGDMIQISELARERGIKIIADCCHALGADYKAGGKPGDGQYEDFGTFSLHPVKSIAMGEGGVVTTNDSDVARRLYLLRGHAMEKVQTEWQHSDMAFGADGAANPWYYEMQSLAYNYRATDMQCALGLSQLKKLDRFIEKRRQIAGWYDHYLASLNNRIKPIRRSDYAHSAWHLYPVLIDFAGMQLDRGQVMKALLARNVGTQVHYIPVSEQPYYRQRYGAQNLPGADQYYGQVLSLPIFPDMTEADVKHVAETLASVIG